MAVHPRGHGEHRHPEIEQRIIDGSSPWARGTLVNDAVINIINRFIPVGTGNTIKSIIFYIVPAVHPRGHGEH